MNPDRWCGRRFAVALATVLAVFAPGMAARADDGTVRTPQAIARTAFPSVVVVVLSEEGTDKNSQGSGFFVGDGLIVTNFHVIAGMTDGWVRVIGSDRRIPIEGVVAADRKHDLVVLKVKESGIPALQRGHAEELSIADKLYAIGNPHGLEGTFSEGLLSSIRHLDRDTMLQITAPISQGSSGGPVFDEHGHVVGVAVGMLKDGQNLNFAIPVNYVEALLAEVGAPVPLIDASGPEQNAGTAVAVQQPVAGPLPPLVAPPPLVQPRFPGPLPDAAPGAGPAATRGPGPMGPDGRTPIDCGTFTCNLPNGWSLERNDAQSSAFSATRRQGSFALLTVFFRDKAVKDVDDYAGSAIATLGEKYLKHRVIDLAGERAYLIMYKAAMEAGPVFASDLRVVHEDVEYTISLWSDANASDIRAVGEDFESLARSWVWR